MANLTRYTPQRRVDPFLEDFFNSPPGVFDWDPFALTPTSKQFGLQRHYPGDNLMVDLYEEGDHLVLKTALPGVNKEDIDIEERDGYLTIRAKTRAEDERQQGGWRVRELYSGSWQRSLRLPLEVNTRKAEATLENGVLTVLLPKWEAQKTLVNKIKVNLPKINLANISKRDRKIKVSRN